MIYFTLKFQQFPLHTDGVMIDFRYVIITNFIFFFDFLGSLLKILYLIFIYKTDHVICHMPVTPRDLI